MINQTGNRGNMKLFANNKKVQEFFEDYTKIAKKHGTEFARRLQRRIAELSSYENVYELFGSKLGSPHYLKGDLDTCLAVSITGNLRLILETGISQKNRNALDVLKLTEIEIKGVVDYHGDKYEWIIP